MPHRTTRASASAQRLFFFGLSSAVLLMVGCSPAAGPIAAPSPTLQEEVRPAALGRVADVALHFPVIESPFSRSTEMAGLVALLLEGGLADLPEVRPSIGGAARPLAGSRAILTKAEQWTGTIGVSVQEGVLRVRLSLCGPDAPCAETAADGPVTAPWEPTAVLLQRAAFTLGRSPPPGLVPTGWAETVSGDPYALLVAGRAAASFYGALPPTAEEDIGDRKRDPLARAVFLDPGISPVWWLIGRRALAGDRPVDASQALARAAVGRPEGLAFLAEEAFVLSVRGRHEEAVTVYEELAEVLPGDLRFVIPHAAAALGSGQATRAAALLDALPPRVQGSPAELAIRVELGVGRGTSSDHDKVLARWQAAAPEDPEPVRRRVRIAVETGRYSDALALTPELRLRGAAEEADALDPALTAALDASATAELPPLDAPARPRRHGPRVAAGRTGAGVQVHSGPA